MSKIKYGIENSSLLLKEVEEAVAYIGSSSSNISNGGGWVSDLHLRLNKCVDSLHSKQRPCCPHFMKKLKAHRAIIKRWLANQPSTSQALA